MDFNETLGRIMILDYNKSILSDNFNPSKFDFNPHDRDLDGPAIFFDYITVKCFRSERATDWGAQP